MIRRKLTILLAVILLSSATSIAQQTRPDEKTEALKAKAYELLESLATQLNTLQSPENRARIGSNIASSLWPHDEKRARAILVEVGENIRLGLKAPETNDYEGQLTLMVFLQLRADTIGRIAEYDPDLAFDFLVTTQPSFEMPRGVEEKERALALRLAKQVVATNPDLALKLGRTVLAQRPSDELLTLLRSLLRKHREQGVILYRETVARLRNIKFTKDYALVSFVFGLARITPPLADETGFRELVRLLITASLAGKCDTETWEGDSRFFCSQVGPLMARMEAVDPRAAKLKHLAPYDENNPWRTEGGYGEFRELAEDRDIDGLIKLAEKYPDVKSMILGQAFDLARMTGDLERAKKTADLFDFSPEEQRRMFAQIERLKDAATLSGPELEEILRQVETIADPKQRVEYLVQNAVRIGANNRTVAIKLLDRATQIIEAQKQEGERTRALIRLAMVYCMEKSDRGFSIMESQLPKLNELIDAAVKLNGFDTQYVRDGEWNMSANGNLGELLTNLSQNAQYFAWCDFDRAVNMAAQFERPEIRMMAQLKLAQSIVAGPPKGFRTN